jgi:hypothetical protein
MSHRRKPGKIANRRSFQARWRPKFPDRASGQSKRYSETERKLCCASNTVCASSKRQKTITSRFAILSSGQHDHQIYLALKTSDARHAVRSAPVRARCVVDFPERPGRAIQRFIANVWIPSSGSSCALTPNAVAASAIAWSTGGSREPSCPCVSG